MPQQSDLSGTLYRIAPEGLPKNVHYTYYEGSWNALPDFERLPPKQTGSVYEFHLEGIESRRDDHYAVKLEGQIQVEQSGRYTFYLTSDDGSKLYVDGTELVDNDGEHGALTKQGDVRLEPGVHQVVVTYRQDTGGELLQVQYQGPRIEKQIFAYNRFLDF